ncbi:hypothetical protein EK21DRAFT_112548 [Setomelanomma holmii]|uniref:Uncharacterized protein n=1 Tax=Setomelanomma holmii TaxID=210430 RepID=A0A9P4HAI2_9PLEO|nr:hypothetical protein EK21DRAFT_112548 [Setomelanomma holmii]
MAPINPGTISKRQVSKITDYEYLADTIPVKVYTELGKAFNNYKVWRNRAAAPPAQRQAGAVNHGRVEKPKVSSADASNRYFRTYFAERQRAEEPRLAWYRDAPARAARRAEEAVRHQEFMSRYKPAKVDFTLPEPQPKPSYMDSVRIFYPPSDDPAHRAKHTNTLFSSIPTISGVSGVGLPSGHTGIDQDPVLAKYNQDKHVGHVLELHSEYQNMQRRQLAKQQRQQAIKDEQRQAKLLEFKLYCDKHDRRVVQLMQYGPKFREEMNKLEHAFENGELAALGQTIHFLVTHIIEPGHIILEEMPEEIKLETMGANELKNTWPLDKIDQMLKRFSPANLSVFNDDIQFAVQYLAQGLMVICKPVLDAVDLVNSLNDPKPLPFVTQPIPVPFSHYMATASTSSQPAPQLQPQIQTSAPASENAGKNFSSFGDLLNSTNNNQVPEIKITPPSDAGNTSIGSTLFGQAPSGVNSTSNTTSAPSSPHKVLVLKQSIDDRVLDFQANVEKLVKDMPLYTAGETGLLGKDDCLVMKNSMIRIVHRISNLRDGKEKNKVTTREVTCLANKVLKIWAET